jgi:hypothetical protein
MAGRKPLVQTVPNGDRFPSQLSITLSSVADRDAVAVVVVAGIAQKNVPSDSHTTPSLPNLHPIRGPPTSFPFALPIISGAGQTTTAASGGVNLASLRLQKVLGI